MVIMPKFDPATFVRAMERHKVRASAILYGKLASCILLPANVPASGPSTGLLPGQPPVGDSGPSLVLGARICGCSAFGPVADRQV